MNYEKELREYISKMSTKSIYGMIDQYTWEMECGLRNHNQKLKLLYEELEGR